jgi:hypothetical protein
MLASASLKLFEHRAISCDAVRSRAEFVPQRSMSQELMRIVEYREKGPISEAL